MSAAPVIQATAGAVEYHVAFRHPRMVRDTWQVLQVADSEVQGRKNFDDWLANDLQDRPPSGCRWRLVAMAGDETSAILLDKEMARAGQVIDRLEPVHAHPMSLAARLNRHSPIDLPKDDRPETAGQVSP